MDASSSFRPAGKAILIAAATTAPASGAQVPGAVQLRGDRTILVWNASANPAVLGYGQDSATAVANAVFPTDTTGKQCLLVPANSVQTFTMVSGLYYAGLSTGGAASLYLQAGDGV